MQNGFTPCGHLKLNSVNEQHVDEWRVSLHVQTGPDVGVGGGGLHQSPSSRNGAGGFLSYIGPMPTMQ